MRRFFCLLLLALPLAACRPAAESLTPPAAEPAALPTETPATVPPPPIVTPGLVEAPPTAEAAAEPAPAAFTPPDLRYLARAFDDFLAAQDNILASYTIIDLESGQEVTQNGDLAISGTSMVKIPILVETYRTLDEPPSPAETRVITETATLSGNYTANLLLELIAGQPDAFAGAELVTRALRRLGLYNTFIAVPYDEEPRAQYMATYVTPANQRLEPTTNPDSSMQTTTADMARLLKMIYDCRQDAGPLRAHYPDTLLPA
jgi:beta-lactamase class A